MIGKLFAGLSRHFKSPSTTGDDNRALCTWGPASLQYFEDLRTVTTTAKGFTGRSLKIGPFTLLGISSPAQGRYLAVDQSGTLKSAKLIAFPASQSAWESDPAREHEFQAMALVENEFVIPIEASIALPQPYPEPNLHALISPYSPFGDVEAYIGATPDRTRAESLAVFLNLLIAVARLHAAGVVHGDIKPGNIVFWQRPQVTSAPLPIGAFLTDFGSARITGSQLLRSTTPQYAAPELWSGDRASEASDIWASGAVAYKLFTGSDLISVGAGNSREWPTADLWDVSLQEAFAPLEFPPRIVAIVCAMLALQPKDRPPAEKIVAELAKCVSLASSPGASPVVGSDEPTAICIVDYALSFACRDFGWPGINNSEHFVFMIPDVLSVASAAKEHYRSKSLGGYVRCADTIDKYLTAAVGHVTDAKELAEFQNASSARVEGTTYSCDLLGNPAVLGELIDLQCRALVNVIEEGPMPRLERQLNDAVRRWLDLQLPMDYDGAATFVDACVFADRADLISDFNFDLFWYDNQSAHSRQRSFHAAYMAGLILRDMRLAQDALLSQIDAAIEGGDLRNVASCVGLALEYAGVTEDDDFDNSIITQMRGVGVIDEFQKDATIQCSFYANGYLESADDLIEHVQSTRFNLQVKRPGTLLLALRCLKRAGNIDAVRNWGHYHLRQPVLALPVWSRFRTAIEKECAEVNSKNA